MTSCLGGAQVAVASRANSIAIEAATSTVAGVFIAFLATVASIIALLGVFLGSRREEDSLLAIGFVPNAVGADDGMLTIHNRGTTSVLLDTVMVNGTVVVRSASSDGLFEIEAGRGSNHRVLLVDRGGSRCFVDFRSLHGNPHEIGVQLKRNTGGWHVADVKKHR